MYENGQNRKESFYKVGKRHGLCTEWYENGQKELEKTYKNGELDGLVTLWYENGDKKYEGTFKDGKQDGLINRTKVQIGWKKLGKVLRMEQWHY